MAKKTWQSQYRVDAHSPWRRQRNFKTRAAARETTAWLREQCGYGRGNTRTVPVINGKVAPYTRVSA